MTARNFIVGVGLSDGKKRYEDLRQMAGMAIGLAFSIAAGAGECDYFK